MEVIEVERGKQGQACVCVAIQTRDLSQNGREPADEFLSFALFPPFCSVLLLCVIPGDVNWHVPPRSRKPGKQLDIRGR